jgi:hypothetical protein
MFLSGATKKSMHLSSMSKVKTNPTTSLNLKSSTFLCRLRSRIGQQQHVPSKSSFSCPNNGTVVKRKGMTSHVNNSKILMVGAPLVQPATGTPENIIHVSVSMTWMHQAATTRCDVQIGNFGRRHIQHGFVSKHYPTGSLSTDKHQ